VCNGAFPIVGTSSTADLCASCALTRTRPSDADAIGLKEFAPAETAKRRMVVELTELGLPSPERAFASHPRGGRVDRGLHRLVDAQPSASVNQIVFPGR
jgi:hypothetical protein